MSLMKTTKEDLKTAKGQSWSGRQGVSVALAAITAFSSLAAIPAFAQAPAAPAQSASGTPRQSGTVKAATDHDFVLTDANGQDHPINVPSGAKVLIVPPGSKDLTAASAGTLSDLQAGDRVLVTGKAGDSGPALTAVRVVVMKSSAIAETHASDQAAWTAGTGGLVKSVDPATKAIVITSAAKTVTVSTSPTTVFRRYSGASVRFEDATRSSLTSVAPGDQLRTRGTRSADGSSFAADEVVTGSFRNYSGEISAVDAAAGTVTLKDLATKKLVTIAVSDQSNVKRLPAELATRYAARQRGGAAAAGAAGRPGARPAGGAAAATAEAAAGEQGAGAARAQGGPAGMGGGSRGGGDLSSMVSRLPSETLGGLKVGDAVMIVASAGEGTNGKPTAITLLAGVEPILSASPAGEAMTLSPWSVGGGGGEAEAGAGPQ